MSSRNLLSIFTVALVIFLTGVNAVLAAENPAESKKHPVYTRECLGFNPPVSTGICRDTRGIGERWTAYTDVIKARYLLETYNTMIEVYNSNRDANCWLVSAANNLRGDVLYYAISAYLWAGPIQYPEDKYELLAELKKHMNEPPYLQVPASLQELVTTGIIDHLPASPYPMEAWVDQLPPSPVQPGTVYYHAFQTTGDRGYALQEPGKLEFYVLAVFDCWGSGTVEPDVIEALFIGTIKSVWPTIPDGICYIKGIYKDAPYHKKKTSEAKAK
jgi:hypothetical protein